MVLKNIIVLLLALASLWLCSLATELKLEEGVGVIMDSEWKMEGHTIIEVEPSDAEKDQLPKDTTFNKKLIYPSNVLSREEAHEKMVHVTVVLSGADSRSIHRPEICLPGQGWGISASEKKVVKLENGDLTVTQLILEREDSLKDGGKQKTRAVYNYFLVGKDKTTASTFVRIWLSNWDNLMHNKAHRWAYPSFMSSYIVKGDGEDAKREKAMHMRVQHTLQKISPQILKGEVVIQ